MRMNAGLRRSCSQCDALVFERRRREPRGVDPVDRVGDARVVAEDPRAVHALDLPGRVRAEQRGRLAEERVAGDGPALVAVDERAHRGSADRRVAARPRLDPRGAAPLGP
jgi:hypothetical protein